MRYEPVWSNITDIVCAIWVELCKFVACVWGTRNWRHLLKKVLCILVWGMMPENMCYAICDTHGVCLASQKLHFTPFGTESDLLFNYFLFAFSQFSICYTFIRLAKIILYYWIYNFSLISIIRLLIVFVQLYRTILYSRFVTDFLESYFINFQLFAMKNWH